MREKSRARGLRWSDISGRKNLFDEKVDQYATENGISRWEARKILLKPKPKQIRGAATYKKEKSPSNEISKENEDGERVTVCSLCGTEVKAKNLKRHKKKVHSAIRVPTTKNINEMTPSERRQHVRRLFGPDEMRESNDLFDRRKVLSGGGVGVGGRKRR